MEKRLPLPEMVDDTDNLLAVQANGQAFCTWLEYSNPSECKIKRMSIVQIPANNFKDVLSADVIFDEDIVEGKFFSAISVEGYIIDHLGYRDHKMSLMINDKFRSYIRKYMGEKICAKMEDHPFVKAVLASEGLFILNITWK